MKNLSQLDLLDKRVFVRADLDVPLETLDETNPPKRLKILRKTVDFLYEKGAAKVIIAGHIGRPEKVDLAWSTRKVRVALETVLSRSVIYKDNFEKDVVENLVLLENLRFWSGEVANDMEFAKRLAHISDVYVNEAFGNSHRAHASMVSLPMLLPHAAGFHLEEEVNQLTKLISDPEKPFVAIVGGAKIETKIPVIENLSKIADFVLVGGYLPAEIAKTNQKFSDNVLVGELASDGKDISDSTIGLFAEKIKGSKTVAWNGPMGLFEEGKITGSLGISAAIVESGAYCVVGGGETVEFLEKNGLEDKFSFVSSGGGAMLELLSGKDLLAIRALD